MLVIDMQRRLFTASALCAVTLPASSTELLDRARRATIDEIRKWIRERPVLTFLGYSGAEYELHAQMLAQAAAVLAAHDPAKVLVNIGVTSAGIGSVYALAKQLGFATMGIVSTQALADEGQWSTAVDQVFMIEDATWGGADAAGMLHPTSAAVVAVSDDIVAIGGGAIARDELLAGRRLGKRCRFIPAESSHALARDKAHKAGKPEPTSFTSALGASGWVFP
jgi:hypothetical protein